MNNQFNFKKKRASKQKLKAPSQSKTKFNFAEHTGFLKPNWGIE